jgi:hypothetical protein
MGEPYFSERISGPKPRMQEEIPESAWGGIIAAIKSSIADGSFGYRYPLTCSDGRGPYGCDEEAFFLALRGDVPEFPWRLHLYEIPPTLVVLDALEFCHQHIAKPIEGSYHSYFGHTHLTFQPEEGQASFRERINQIFARNGIAYQLDEHGRVVRLLPEVLQVPLTSTEFQTGDTYLDELLEAARNKYLDPNPTIRQESLEKLWDAWERLKTVEQPGNKKVSARALLDRAADEPRFRDVVEQDARALTDIGNHFTIRHSETDKVQLQRNEHVDYLFHRLFALLRLLLRATNRGG